MEHGFDIVQQLSRALENEMEIWNFAHSFAAAWMAPIVDGDGVGEEDALAIQSNLAFQFPASLWQAYKICGHRRDIIAGGHQFLMPSETRFYAKEKVIVYRVDDIGEIEWGLAFPSDDLDNPPTVFRRCIIGDGSDSWEPWLPSFPLAFLDILLTNALVYGEKRPSIAELSLAEMKMLDEYFYKVPIPVYPDVVTASRVLCSSKCWYVATDLLICCEISSRPKAPDFEPKYKDPWRLEPSKPVMLTVRSRRRQALDGLRGLFPDSWW